MYINALKAAAPKFSGCAEPYTRNGIKIIPISQNPDEKFTQDVFETAEGKPFAQGKHAKIFDFKDNLVIKHYINEKFAEHEIDILNKMHDFNILIPCAGRGVSAFKKKNGGIYLVSDKFNGLPLNKIKDSLDIKNLQLIMEALYQLDMPVENPGRKEEFPFCSLMHYDLHPGNILLDGSRAGIIDFENAVFGNLFYDKDKPKKYIEDSNCYISDIPGVKSNLREFEFNIFFNLLVKNGSIDINKFAGYLRIKSGYHKKRAEFFEEKAEQYQDKEIKQQLKTLAQKEYAHYKMLKNPKPAVIEAELAKIQAAVFAYTADASIDLIPRGIKEDYVKSFVSSFKERFQKESDRFTFNKNKKIYWNDCAELFKIWTDDADKLCARIRERK